MLITEWMNEWMNERTDGRTIWTNERMNFQITLDILNNVHCNDCNAISLFWLSVGAIVMDEFMSRENTITIVSHTI